MERGTTEGHGSQRRSEGIRPGPRWRNSFWAEGTLHPRAPGKEVRMNKVINALTSSICLYYTLPHFTKDLRSFYSEVDRLKGTGSYEVPLRRGGVSFLHGVGGKSPTEKGTGVCPWGLRRQAKVWNAEGQRPLDGSGPAPSCPRRNLLQRLRVGKPRPPPWSDARQVIYLPNYRVLICTWGEKQQVWRVVVWIK